MQAARDFFCLSLKNAVGSTNDTKNTKYQGLTAIEPLALWVNAPFTQSPLFGCFVDTQLRFLG